MKKFRNIRMVISISWVITLSLPVFSQVLLDDSCRYGDKEIPWSTRFGDGEVKTYITPKKDFLRFSVNSMNEPHNVWWATIWRDIPFVFDGNQDIKGKKIWMEAKIRPSNAPRRINMRIYPERPSNDHAYLKEFDLDDTTWHTVRFSPGLDILPGDKLGCHMAMIDWGNGEFYIDVKEVKIFFTDEKDSLKETSSALVYHPEPRSPASFSFKLPVMEDGMVDLEYPERVLKGWGQLSGNEWIDLVSVSYKLIPVLRWDFKQFTGHTTKEWGLLTLVVREGIFVKTSEHEYGRIRVMEILDGKANWTHDDLSFDAIAGGKGKWEIFNEQMMIDMDVPPGEDKILQIPVSPAVLQRLLQGKSKGLAIFPLGSIQVSFYSKAYREGKYSAMLYFD